MLHLDDVQLFSVLLSDLTEASSELMTLLLVLSFSLMLIYPLTLDDLVHLRLKRFILNSSQSQLIFKSLFVVLDSMLEFKVVVGQAVVQGLHLGQPCSKNLLLLLEVAFLQVKLLSSDRPILLVPLDCVMEQSFLLS